ncbi:alpha-hydroxy-acid oxidizing enzyme (plasmid) [Rhizobium sp. ACO-34A]|nr:alpha-hydroxy acid oxidase [Rhizobium sp. ACO-34A]ATN37472.1 alpha-hydroxy-acid oxidizing enzyme [Rhizobium sp. ACO-34A]
MSIPPDTVSLADYERHFHERADAQVRAYFGGAAADGVTQRENRAAFDAIRLLPRALADLSGASAASSLFGETLHYPIILAPTAYHRLAHPEGELATAQAASLTRTWMTVSTLASASLETIASTSTSPLWFQLYFQPQREYTLTLVRRAEQAGYRAIMVTIDAVVNGIRNEEQRAGFRLPAGIRAVNLDGMPAPVSSTATTGSPVFSGMLAHAPTWVDIEWLCRQTELPVIVKGLLSPSDVSPALDAGVSGIVVSNHGGRVLDTLPATIEVLPAIAEIVAGRVPVLMDGGIRRGTDIVKALALGASAVLIGQPVIHALGVGGMAGVAHMLTILQTELEATLALLGRPRLADIDRSVLWTRN